MSTGRSFSHRAQGPISSSPVLSLVWYNVGGEVGGEGEVGCSSSFSCPVATLPGGLFVFDSIFDKEEGVDRSVRIADVRREC